MQYQQHLFFEGGFAPLPLTVGGPPLTVPADALHASGGTNGTSPVPDSTARPLVHDRVADETAPVTVLVPDHPVLRRPNRISEQRLGRLDPGARSLLRAHLGPGVPPAARDARPRRGRRSRAACSSLRSGREPTSTPDCQLLPAAAGRGARRVPAVRQPARAGAASDRVDALKGADESRRSARHSCPSWPARAPRARRVPQRRPDAGRRCTLPTAATSSPCSSTPSSAERPGHRRALARHGLAGDPRPAAVRAGEPAGRRLVRRADDHLRSRRPGLAARAVPSGLGRPGRTRRHRTRTTSTIRVVPDAGGHRLQQQASCPPRRRPHDWDDVLAPRWHDKVLIRDPMASGTMRAIWGLDPRAQHPRDRRHRRRAWRWLRRLDGQTKAYALNPAILDAKLARGEGLVTLWDLPDILISRSKGMPFGYVFPRSGTVVIDDAIGLVRGSRHPEAAQGVHRLRRQRRGPAARGATRSSGFRRDTTSRRTGCRRGSRRSSARWWWHRWTGDCSRAREPPG